jgi:tyrosyl-tRNA synthetase
MDALKLLKKELDSPAGEGKNPRDVKAELAKVIVEMYYTAEDAEKAAGEFDKVFARRETPTEMPILSMEMKSIRLDDLLLDCKLASSRAEAKRLIEQGGVEVSGKRITDSYKTIQLQDEMIVRVGKRNFAKIKIKK